MLEKSLLFHNIDEKELKSLLACLNAIKRKYKKGDFIFMSEDKVDYIGLVISGSVNIIEEDIFGNRSILGRATPGELFAEAFVCAGVDSIPVSVVANENTDIMLIDYTRILTTCDASCTFHTKLIKNMMQILASKNISLTRKINCISQGNIKEKILNYVTSESIKAKSNIVTIPFNRQELADYLSVNRSALSRALSEMKEEGILDYKKNKFKLLS